MSTPRSIGYMEGNRQDIYVIDTITRMKTCRSDGSTVVSFACGLTLDFPPNEPSPVFGQVYRITVQKVDEE